MDFNVQNLCSLVSSKNVPIIEYSGISESLDNICFLRVDKRSADSYIRSQ